MGNRSESERTAVNLLLVIMSVVGALLIVHGLAGLLS